MREMKDSGIEWIGEIPRGWEISKAKYFIKIQNGSDPTTDGNIPVYGSGSESFKTCGEYKEGPTVLIGRKGTINIPRYIEGKYWNVDTAFDVHSLGKFNLKYYFYCAVSFDYKFYISQTTLPSMTQTNYENIFLPIPNSDEQHRIADFLDRKCAEIDAVIEKTKAAVEGYKKLKQSVITEAVTKGVRGPRPMKPSGVEWIEDVPEGWNVSRIKYISDIFGRIGFRGYTQNDIVSNEEGAISLSPSNFSNMKMNFEKCTYISWDKYYESPEIMVNIGDIIFVKTGSSYGKSAYVSDLPKETTINPQLIVFKHLKINSKLFSYILNTPIIQYQAETVISGGTIPTMSQENIGNFRLPVPPLSEQDYIVDYLDRKCTGIDNILAKKQQFIKELEAYKKSLIYEYVTGKKEVK